MNKNKILGTLFIGVFMLLFLSVFGLADVEVSGLTDNKVVLDVNYGSLGEDDEDNDTMALSPLSLTFKNNGAGQEAISLELANILTDYQLELSETSFTLGVSGEENDSKTVTLSAVVPVDVDSGNHSIGKLKFGDIEYEIETFVVPMLEIEEIGVYVDDKKEDTVDDDGEEIKDIRPGSEIELRFEIENLFDDDYGEGDIEEIELTIEFEDNDDEDDFEGEIDEEAEFDLDAGDKVEGDEVVIKFDVPGNAKEQSYDLAIKLEGEDGNGAKHTVRWLIELELDREKDDVQIEKADLTTEILKCTRDTQLKVMMTNFGSNNQKDAALSIYSEALGMNYNFKDIYLDKDPDDEDNSYSKTIPVSLADDFGAGDYYIEVRAYVDSDEQVAYNDVKLVVESCSVEEPEEEEEERTEEEEEVVEEETVVVEEFLSADNAPASGQFIESGEIPFTQIKGIVIFIGVAIALLVVLIILVIYVLIRK